MLDDADLTPVPTPYRLEAEERFRSVFMHMAEGVAIHEVMFDSAGAPVNYRILDVNPQFELFTGLSPISVIGQLATEAYKTTSPPFLAEYAAVAMSGKPTRIETHFGPLGRDYEISVAPMGYGHFATIFSDVTERKRQEQALRVAEQALRVKTDELDHFFNLTPDMLCIASLDARLVRVNAAWERILGWPLEQLVGRCYLELVHPEDLEATNQVRVTQTSGIPTIDFTNRYRCRDGSYRWIEWRSTPGENGCVYAAARDVTEWIEHERAMRESEERYRLLVELSPFMVAIHEDGILKFVNRAGAEMVGATSPGELIGRPVVEFVPDEGQAITLRNVTKSEQLEKPGTMLEQRLVRLDGRELNVEVSGVRFPYRGGTATLMVALDVTERKRGERERKVLSEQLQQSQKLESIGRLAGGVAHDFNNLLTVIMSCTDGLLTSDIPSSELRSDVLDIADASRRAAELTRQLLAFSRQQVLQPRTIILRDVIEAASRMLRRLLGEDIDLVVEASEEGEFVFVDPGQVEQILVNLAVNARDAMPDGGRLTVETSTVALSEAIAAGQPDITAGLYVMLTVTDTGIGMDESTRARAFDPFFTTKSTKGTGLGLATVYGIVKQSGGHIWIQSERGVGTTFKIYLPRASESPLASSIRVPPALDYGDETILLVEDEAQVRRTIERVLVSAGYRVLVAADGEEALELCDRSVDAIHLLLTDVVMPKMTGRQLAERVTSAKPTTRVLYMSGYTPDAIVHHGVLDEGIEFIQKPLTPAVLLAKLREVLAK